MGAFLDKYVIRNNEPLIGYKTILCSDNSVATYRCQMKIPCSINYNYDSSDEKIRQLSSILTSHEINALILLKSYYKSVNHENIVKFIASNLNITPEVEKYFTYYPNSWKEVVGVSFDYEWVNVSETQKNI
jgi:hypothetical protein